MLRNASTPLRFAVAAIGLAALVTDPSLSRAESPLSLTVASASFAPGTPIPRRYTCDGGDISPELHWSAAPAAAKSLALVVEDPDAPVLFTHWILYNLPPQTRSLPENASAQTRLPLGAAQGINNFGAIGYRGPCPPPGRPHRYIFRVYALDARLDFPAGITRVQFDAAIRGHLLASGSTMGIYGHLRGGS
ncbi:MAG: YbhB/YbcL family Raf kinase inhibitor-like protein [Acidobacteriaceae bacterium]